MPYKSDKQRKFVHANKLSGSDRTKKLTDKEERMRKTDEYLKKYNYHIPYLP